MNQANTPPHYNSGPVRDLQLDAYRALIMIFIPCVIHVMFWLGKAGEPFKSIFLFEMPVVFYISGASMYIANKHQTIRATAINRFKRIMLPYYRYASTCLLLVVIVIICRESTMRIDGRSILKLLAAQDSPVPIPYMFHLWFIVPYMAVACLFPLNRRLCDKCNRWKYLATYFIILLVTEPVWEFLPSRLTDVIRQTVYYNFFFIAGYLTYKRVTLKQTAVTGILAALILIALLYNCDLSGEPLGMQKHKFPPDMLFVSYGILALCVISQALRNIHIPNNRVLRYWNRHGYELYLWQNFSFAIVAFVCQSTPLIALRHYPVIDFAAAAALIFVCEYAISFALRLPGRLIRTALFKSNYSI